MRYFKPRSAYETYSLVATQMRRSGSGWVVLFADVSDKKTLREVSEEGRLEIIKWILATLPLSMDDIDRDMNLWGMAFDDETDALLCYLHFRRPS